MTLIESAKKVAVDIREYSLAMSDTDMDAALKFAQVYGNYLWANPIGIYEDSEFERLLTEHLSGLLKGRFAQRVFDTLHLITTAYSSGGHTRVVERFLRIGIGEGLAALDDLPETVMNNLPDSIKVFKGIRQLSGIATISHILDIGLNYKNVILHIHPDDIYSSIAASLLHQLGVKIFMYNHADHVFSFGYSAAEKVLEISKYGWMRGNLRGIENKQTFVGIPILSCNLRPVEWTENNLKIIFIAGSTSKFIPWGNYSVPEFINQMYQDGIFRNGVKITICGPTGREKYWKNLKSKTRTHVKFIGQRPHDEYLNRLLTCACYIDSFPFPNGTGLAESVSYGIPSFGLDLLAGYSLADALRSHSVEELTASITSHIKNRHSSYSHLLEIREQIIKEQSVEICAERLRFAMESSSYIPLLDGLSSMRCMKDYTERVWESNQKIYIPLALIKKISFRHQIEFLKILSRARSHASIYFRLP